MIQVAVKNGLSHHRTIKISQELDYLMNRLIM
ncbi:hypothetical protein CJ195_24085 [Bacillus sp. UMB0899]|nr:hypothetical protein CJ195_24085 [Bacillus sp. UMB0899]